MSKLTPESTMAEYFEFFNAGDDAVGAQVIPVTIKQQNDDTRLAILIKGDHHMASVIMAELMTRVEELFDMSHQAEATESDKPTIITP